MLFFLPSETEALSRVEMEGFVVVRYSRSDIGRFESDRNPAGTACIVASIVLRSSESSLFKHPGSQ